MKQVSKVAGWALAIVIAAVGLIVLLQDPLAAGQQEARAPLGEAAEPHRSLPQTNAPSPDMLVAEPSSRTAAPEPANNAISELSAEQGARLRESVLRTTRLIYEDIDEAAGLSQAEAEALITLLANQEIAFFSLNINPIESVPDAEQYKELQARNRAEISAHVGATRAAAVAEYQKSINARFEVEELRSQLESAGMPITEAQRQALIKAAIHKGAYVPMPQFSGAVLWDAMGQELLARIQQRDQVMLEIARSMLNISQVSLYDEYVQRRSAAMEDSLRKPGESSN